MQQKMGTQRQIHTYMEAWQFAINDHYDVGGIAAHLRGMGHTVHETQTVIICVDKEWNEVSKIYSLMQGDRQNENKNDAQWRELCRLRCEVLWLG